MQAAPYGRTWARIDSNHLVARGTPPRRPSAEPSSRTVGPKEQIMTYGWRAKVGIIVPSGNSVSEPQFRMMAPPGVEFFAARLRLEREGADRYLKMAEGIEDAAGLLADLRPSFILFHCTAVSV